MRKVKSINTYTSILMPGSIEVIKEYLKEEELYDLNGNLIFHKVYSDKGLVESIHTYRFNSNNDIVEVIHSLEDEKNITSKHTFSYNEERILLTEKLEYNDGSVEELLSQQTKDPDGNVTFELKNSFNEKGELIEYQEYALDKDPIHIRYELDSVGSTSRELILNSKGKIIETNEHRYNDRDQLIYIKTSDTETRNYFNEDGLLERVETKLLEENLVESFTEYSYDKYQNVINEVYFHMGHRYEMEPGVQARTKSVHTHTRYEYEFWDEALVYTPSH